MKRFFLIIISIGLAIVFIINPIVSSLQIDKSKIIKKQVEDSTETLDTYPDNYKKYEFEKATIEGTFIPWPYDSQFVLKLPCSFPFEREFKNVEIRYFKGLIIPNNESREPLNLYRYNGTNIATGYVHIFSNYLSGEDSVLTITKSTMHKGVYHIEGVINNLTVEIYESELDADHGNIIVGFRNYVTIFHAVAFGLIFKIRLWGILRIFPVYYVLYEVQVGEEFYWMARFNTFRCVVSTEFNTICHGT